MLEFRASDHTYWLGSRRLPSVSEVIAPLSPFANGSIPSRHLDAARLRGSAVHLACQLDDERDLEEASLDPWLQPYVVAWRDFRRLWVGELLAIERPLADATRGFAGTPDRIARSREGRLVVVDIKTGDSAPVHAIQLAAYAELARAEFEAGARRVQRLVVRLMPDGKFSLIEHKTGSDWNVFLAALSLWKWRESHR